MLTNPAACILIPSVDISDRVRQSPGVGQIAAQHYSEPPGLVSGLLVPLEPAEMKAFHADESL